jgi:hypothetical protein
VHLKDPRGQSRAADSVKPQGLRVASSVTRAHPKLCHRGGPRHRAAHPAPRRRRAAVRVTGAQPRNASRMLAGPCPAKESAHFGALALWRSDRLRGRRGNARSVARRRVSRVA